MSNVSDAISYIHNNYPDSQTNLSVERLINLIYLSDWKYAISYAPHSQITGIKWKIRDFRPWMDDNSVQELVEILTTIRAGKLLRVSPMLQDAQKQSIDFVIDSAVGKNENDLSKLVHSTFPAIKQSNSSNTLDFAALAEQYETEYKPFLGSRS